MTENLENELSAADAVIGLDLLIAMHLEANNSVVMREDLVHDENLDLVLNDVLGIGPDSSSSSEDPSSSIDSYLPAEGLSSDPFPDLVHHDQFGHGFPHVASDSAHPLL
ncbi:hypothetical protein [Cyanobium sp. FACHB-13342]|uniref:hypothetical protein n=1 Tax=Cyanobium sp. FACHB-13342 TaxID=2692793 RepID=UPI00168106B3|nr:hypothetical protein [Cyanobium sp. FACHB-13342]MBD2421934.1 hypothetical protein [Cyanobium sp. FACHB-13342]